MSEDSSRGADVLRELALAGDAELDAALRRILRADANALGVERVSYWALRDGPSILCESLFIRTEDRVDTTPVELTARDFPGYFAALATGEVIAAHDAHTDARTREFSAPYLGPLGIGAMLDVPVFVRGAPAGVICHEHVGPARTWTAAEQSLAWAVGQSLSLAMESQARRRAEQQARDGERRFRAIVEASPTPMLVLRQSDSTCMYGNEAAAQLFGIPLAEISQHRARHFFVDEEERDALVATLFRDGRVRGHEVQLRRRDGTPYWAAVAMQLVTLDEIPAIICGLNDVTARRRVFEALREDLRQARAFQQSILPVDPNVPGLRIETGYWPVDLVGGDLFDIDRLDERHVRLLVVDATGHGVQAAMTTMFIRSEYEEAKSGARGPADVLRVLNERLTQSYRRLGLRYTALCMDLDTITGELRWSSAAHPAPCVVGRGATRELDSGGTFVGMVDGVGFPEWTVELAPGDAVCAYTDGLTEAFDEKGEAFGDARLHEALAAADREGEPLGEAALRAARAFVGGSRSLSDDAAFVALRWSPPRT